MPAIEIVREPDRKCLRFYGFSVRELEIFENARQRYNYESKVNDATNLPSSVNLVFNPDRAVKDLLLNDGLGQFLNQLAEQQPDNGLLFFAREGLEVIRHGSKRAPHEKIDNAMIN
jgi:hypothetical protein